MSRSYKATVIISIYNNIKALAVLLDSLKYQSEQSFEIIISEDAEHEAVAEFIANYDFVHDYQHLTRPDVGWQKNHALNRAVKAARSDYFIFVDGDCILHPRFVESHLKFATPKGIVAGKRVKLNEELSDLLIESVSNFERVERRLKMMLCGMTKSRGTRFIEEGIFGGASPLSTFFVTRLRKIRSLTGCNMSFSREAIYAINGFDEEYIRPAIGEDTDLKWRFEGLGYHLVSVRNLAVQYHLHHKENYSDKVENIRLMNEKRGRKEYVCQQGLNRELEGRELESRAE